MQYMHVVVSYKYMYSLTQGGAGLNSAGLHSTVPFANMIVLLFD